MRKIKLALAALLMAIMGLSITSCSDSDKENFALLGAWKCNNISGNVGGVDLSQFGISTSNSSSVSKYTKLFTIYFIGGTSGTYIRIGDTETFGDAASNLSSALTQTSGDKEKLGSSLAKFLKRGTYTANGNTLTLTSSDGETEEYTYSISGNTLTLTENNTVTDNSTVKSATNILNAIIKVADPDTDKSITNTAGISYTYEKMSLANLIQHVASGNNE